MSNARKLADNLPSVGQLSGRNMITNGNMTIDQRNSGSATTPTADQTVTLDRFKARLNNASKYSVQQVTDTPSGYYNSLKVTSAAATTVGTNDYYQIATPLEGYNVSQLDLGLSTAKKFTISFWVKSSLTGTFGGAYSNNIGDRFIAWTYTISSANTWEHKTVTVDGVTDGSWERSTGAGLHVYWTLGAGSGVQTTAGAWGTSFKRGPTGATNVVATNGATWQITGVQLEVGSQSTPFEYEPYDTTIRKCGRYYQRISADAGFDYGTIAPAIGSTAAWYVPIPLKYGDMRVDPTLSYSAVGNFRTTLQHSHSNTCTSISIGYNHTDRPMLSVQAGSNSAGSLRLFGFNGASSGWIAFDAEL